LCKRVRETKRRDRHRETGSEALRPCWRLHTLCAGLPPLLPWVLEGIEFLKFPITREGRFVSLRSKVCFCICAICEHALNNRHLRKAPVPGKQREDLISTTSSPSGCLLWKHLRKHSTLTPSCLRSRKEGNSQLHLHTYSH
jgi:hypothetical protein